MFDLIFRIVVYIMFIAGCTCLAIGLVEVGFNNHYVAFPLIACGLFMAALGGWGIDIDAKDRQIIGQRRAYRNAKK